MKPLDFTGKTILVTGATRGIGKQIADDLGLLNANLILTGTNPEQIKVLNEESAESGAKRQFFCVDLMKRESTEEFINQLEDFPKIDGLVNNAGINRLNSINNILTDDWEDMLAVNLSSPFKLIKCVSGKMIENKYGRIVNIASIFSRISKEKRSAYSATKFGLEGLTVGVSNDLARYNIMVNAVSPGFVLTDLTRKNLSEEEMINLSNQVPARRLAEVADISNVVVFLLSELNSYLTGQNIVVDGGFTNV
jgi:3-oxoacyl-[acyl-carrier protein] reductase